MSNKPQDHKSKQPTAAKNWKKAAKRVELTLPSGNVCLAKPMQITKMLSDGFFPDSLRGIVLQQIGDEKISEAESAAAVQNAFQDMTGINEMFEVFDRVCMAVILEPVVLPAPENEADRNDDIVYIDEVDQEDKMFIFQWAVGGDTDIERFREESANGVGSLENI